MILFAMIVRSSDGLPLSASTDVGGQMYQDTKEMRMQMKLISRQISRFDDRCTISLNPHLVHIISSLGVSFMALCESSYPPVLAFSFLDELLKEFITKHDTKELNNSIRPYAFIDFDSFIQKTRQRYNSPRSLTTRIDLSTLSTEIKLRPPQQLNLGNLLPQNSSFSPVVLSGGSSNYFFCLPWYGILSTLLSFPCIMSSAYRGISGLGESSIEEIDGTSPFHGVAFLIEAVVGCIQICLLFYNVRRRVMYAWGTLIVTVICNLALWEIKDLWQLLLFVGISSLCAYSIIMKHKPKNKNYTV